MSGTSEAPLTQLTVAVATKGEDHAPFDLSHQGSAEGLAWPVRPVARTAADRLGTRHMTAEIVKIDNSGCSYGRPYPEREKGVWQVAAGSLGPLACDLETKATTAKDR